MGKCVVSGDGNADRTEAPAPLIGLSEIPATGALAFVRLDPTTGEEQLRVAMSELGALLVLSTSCDAQSGRFFVFGVISGDPSPGHLLVTIDPMAGTVISSVPVPIETPAPGQNWQIPASLEVTASGDLVGLVGTNEDRTLLATDYLTLNPDTGQQTVLSSVPPPISIYDNRSAIEANRGRYYHVAVPPGTDEGRHSRLLTIDTTSGDLLHDVITDRPLFSVEVDARGRVIALGGGTGDAPVLLEVDPLTGMTSQMAPVPTRNAAGALPGFSAVDREALVFYQEAIDPSELVAVDLYTGDTRQSRSESVGSTFVRNAGDGASVGKQARDRRPRRHRRRTRCGATLLWIRGLN